MSAVGDDVEDLAIEYATRGLAVIASSRGDCAGCEHHEERVEERVEGDLAEERKRAERG